MNINLKSHTGKEAVVKKMKVVVAPLRVSPLGAHIDHQLGEVTGLISIPFSFFLFLFLFLFFFFFSFFSFSFSLSFLFLFLLTPLPRLHNQPLHTFCLPPPFPSLCHSLKHHFLSPSFFPSPSPPPQKTRLGESCEGGLCCSYKLYTKKEKL